MHRQGIIRAVLGSHHCCRTHVWFTDYQVKEISPLSLKGLTASIHQLLVMAGVLLSYLIGYSIPLNTKNPRLMWVAPFTLPFGAAIICGCLLMFYYKYDSPLFYISKGDGRYKVAFAYAYNDKAALDEAIENVEKESVEMKTLNITWKELFRKYFKNLLLIALIAIFNQINGINAIRYHSTAMFELIGIEDEDARKYTLLIGISLIIAPIISMFTSDAIGRKPTLIIGSSIISICLYIAAIGVYFYVVKLVVIFTILFTLFWCFSYGSLY